MCAVPRSGLVIRSAASPLTSAGCRKMARSPSRSDWKASEQPSRDHTGMRSLPRNVNRRRAVEPSRSYTQMLVSWPSTSSNARREPSGEILGEPYWPAGSLSALRALFPSTDTNSDGSLEIPPCQTGKVRQRPRIRDIERSACGGRPVTPGWV